jgi:hypothetical protein
MDEAALKEWFKLTDETKKNIFGEISNKTGLPPAAVEKDWWVVRTLDLVFQMEVGKHTVFKGGTSLSKAWNLIDRFSEDIDLALDYKQLDVEKVENNSQLSKLKKKSFKYISEIFYPQIEKKYTEAGFKDLTINVAEVKSTDQDPLIVEVYYPSVTDKIEYINPRVWIEIGSRSLMEPSSKKSFCSLVGEHYPDRPFADKNITIPTVNPEKTFLEKIFLLHEEFQKPAEKIKVERLSRHLYDLEKIMDTDFGKKALVDGVLYNHIVEHRKVFNPLTGVDYANHIPTKINPIPPDDKLKHWEKDYKEMRANMIQKDSLPFDKLIGRIKELKDRINKLKF